MPPAVFADPKMDSVFQRIFSAEERKPILIALLNAVLGLEDERRIVAVEHLPPEQRPKIPEMKYSIVEVKCFDTRGAHYVVMMQVLYLEAYERHVGDRVAETCSRLPEAVRPYPEMNDLVGISLCRFTLWPSSTYPDIPMLSFWRTPPRESAPHGLNPLQLVYLELPKLDRSREPETPLEKWAYFFSEAPNLEVTPPVIAAEPTLRDALEAARGAKFTIVEWDAYTRELIAIQDKVGRLQAAFKRGYAEGMAKGLAEARRERLRPVIEDLCEVLGIPLDAARQEHLAHLDAAGLEALLNRLRTQRTWE